MSRQTHLDRGYCCNQGCVFCPWRLPVDHSKLAVDSRIEAALRSGEVTTIHSERMSLVPQLTIQNLTIIYQPYVEPVPQREDSKEIH
jgi:hypothetical protein